MINEWIVRLQGQCPSVNKRVFGAAELAALDKTLTGQTPSLYVIPISEQAKSRIIGEFYTENTLLTIAIVTTVRNVQDSRGQGAHQQLEPVRNEIKAALCGWQESTMTHPVHFIQGRIASYDNQLLRYIDVYTTHTSFRQPVKL
jgi:hypothetical protein